MADKNPFDITVSVNHEVNLSDVIFELVYKCVDPKKIITLYGCTCITCGNYSPDEKSVEIHKAGIILGYVVKNWDKLYEPALKHYHECMKKIENG
jgi:hypothetical protein